MNLTKEQSDIIDQQGGSFKITAAAGSGKTTTLTLYVRKTISLGIKDTEIVFITFTRLAAQEIRSKIRKLIGAHTDICCGTFHRVMFRFMREAGITMPSPVHLYDGCMERHVEFVLAQMRTPTPALLALLQSYKLLVVDEFQDLDPPQFEFIAIFKRIQPLLRIIAIGDLAQNIYRFRNTSNEFLRRLLQSEIVPDLKEFKLTTNFRSSATILHAVNTIFAEDIYHEHILPMVASLAEGVKPRYYEYARTPDKGIGAYEGAVVEVLVPLIKEAKAAGKSVALIFPKIKCQSYTFIEGLLYSYLPYTDFNRIAKEDSTTSIVEITYDAHDMTAPVQISSFHASKGLEWDIVALINVSDDIYALHEGEVETEESLAEKTNLLYVGLTRPIETLLIFANSNHGGRHRLLARAGSTLNEVMDVTLWGEDTPLEHSPSNRIAGVSDLVRRLAQHPDLYARITACSEHIGATFHRGEPLKHDTIYAEMKKRNRELAFGTFIDWMVKRSLTREPTLQCRLLEILGSMNSTNWFHKEYATASMEMIIYAIEQFFDRAGNMPNTDLSNYIMPVRIIAGFSARKYMMTPDIHTLYSRAERRIMKTYKSLGDEMSIREAYILSHTLNLYARGQLSEIYAVDAPVNTYKGLPAGFDEFAAASVIPSAEIIRLAVGTSEGEYHADIPVETESLIQGEVDLIFNDGIIEIKCGSATTTADLRGASSCSNLLQLLAYVAMGRHGTQPFAVPVTWALLINPLTATWERYDLTTWSDEQSRKFLACLVELQGRSG